MEATLDPSHGKFQKKIRKNRLLFYFILVQSDKKLSFETFNLNLT
jgi:hypothetical protein